LHANFAFSKAYLAEHDGTRAGLPGPALYIDMALFDNPAPTWLGVQETIAWTAHGMSATFARCSIDWRAADKTQFSGALDAAGVCKNLEALAAVAKQAGRGSP
jgi:hypothetical protein